MVTKKKIGKNATKKTVKKTEKKSKKEVAVKKKKVVKVTPVKVDPNAIEAFLLDNNVITECSNEARLLEDKSCYGTILNDGRVQLTLIEAYYLYDKNKIVVFNGKKALSKEDFQKKCIKKEKNFWTRYAVYADFRNRGYTIKTALKFGADFRVYNKGIKPGQDHARWIVYPVKETNTMTWYEFAAKNRVAHSTKKRLLIGVVDEENSVTYYEVKWTRP